MAKKQKNKKIIKRISALCAVALVLFMAIVPALSPKANAMTCVPSEMYGPEGYDGLNVFKWLLPLDIMRSECFGITVENPMYLSSSNYGLPFESTVSNPAIEGKPTHYGQGSFMGEWIFNFLEFTPLRYDDRNRPISGLSDFRFQIDAGLVTNSFSFYNSESFVATPSIVNQFLKSLNVDIFPGYNVYVDLYAEYYSANITSDGYEVDKFTLDCFEDSFIDVVMPDGSINKIPINSEESYFYSPFENYDVLNELAFIDSPDSSLLLFTEFFIKFSFENPVDGFADPGGSDRLFYYSGFHKLRVATSIDGTGSSFMDFYNSYPAEGIFWESTSNSTGGLIGSTLKNAVSSFLSTEILPGFSFGGVLGVLLGIGIVMLLFKWFGGN